MNYRHVFHAGNHADVLKHIVLLELLRLLTAKDKPLAYMESHAGAGSYPLANEAEKTGEWRDGIGRLWGAANAPAPVERYLSLVRSCNGEQATLRRYPGSPALAARVLRTRDRLVLCESEPDIADELSTRVARHDKRIHVLRADGYHEALNALLPPPERRGLVLVDPPYEAQQAEFDRILTGLATALKRFATGSYAVWYPIKRAADTAPFLRTLRQLPAKSILTAELWVRATDSALRLNGSGIALINPPWRIDDGLPQWLAWLCERLAGSQRGAGWRVDWVKTEIPA